MAASPPLRSAPKLLLFLKPTAAAERRKRSRAKDDAHTHPVPLINILPNNTTKSHTLITMNATPKMKLCRSFATAVSFVTDAWSVGVLDILGSLTAANESFAATGVSFFTEDCAVGALSPLLLGGTSGFETALGDVCAAINGSWD